MNFNLARFKASMKRPTYGKKWRTMTMTTTICMKRIRECVEQKKNEKNIDKKNNSELKWIKREDSSLFGRCSRRLTIRIQILITYFFSVCCPHLNENTRTSLHRIYAVICRCFISLFIFDRLVVSMNNMHAPCPVSLHLCERRGTLVHTFLFS